MFLYQGFRITGGADAIKYADPLQSTDAEQKRLVALAIQMDAYAGTDDVDIKLYHERAEILNISAKMFGQCGAALALEQVGSERITELPIDIDIPKGESIKAAVQCAGEAENVRGYYKYEIIT